MHELVSAIDSNTVLTRCPEMMNFLGLAAYCQDDSIEQEDSLTPLTSAVVERRPSCAMLVEQIQRPGVPPAIQIMGEIQLNQLRATVLSKLHNSYGDRGARPVPVGMLKQMLYLESEAAMNDFFEHLNPPLIIELVENIPCVDISKGSKHMRGIVHNPVSTFQS